MAEYPDAYYLTPAGVIIPFPDDKDLAAHTLLGNVFFPIGRSAAQLAAAIVTFSNTATPTVPDEEEPEEEEPPATPPVDPTTGSAYCGTETRVSGESCNSILSAVAIDPSGAPGIVWVDTRDGNFEIYFKALESQVTPDLVDAISNMVTDPQTGRVMNLPSGFSQTIALEDIEALGGAGGGSSQVNARLNGGRIDVNVLTRTISLTASTDVDFNVLGVLANTKISILSGLNAGNNFFVSRILSSNVLDLVYFDGPQSDTGFVYDVVNSNSTRAATGDVRLTVSRSTSTYPDIVADSQGRYLIVYQDNATGVYELSFIEIFPACVGQKKCGTPTSAFGQISVAPSATNPNPSTVTSSVDARDGQPFFYGNISLPDPLPTPDINPLLRNGSHRLIREEGSPNWIGLSKAADRITWDAQAANLSITDLPPYEAAAGTPFADEDDFGEQYTFQDVAIMAQSPSDMDVEVTRIVFPIKPKCAPASAASSSIERSQDLVSAPKRPAPVTFQDPSGLAQILTSPFVTTDASVPTRFTIDGDPTGTVFSNIVLANPVGESSRIVFTKDSGCGEDTIKFILGQRKCGTELCAVKASDDALESSPARVQYKMNLQVWLGSSYLSESHTEDETMSAEKIFEQEFDFDPSGDISSYQLLPGQLTIPGGRYVLFVLQPDSKVGVYYQGVGGGHSLWTTSGDGTFTQYYQPWTIAPNSGVSLPVYYEGTLRVNPDIDVVDDTDIDDSETCAQTSPTSTLYLPAGATSVSETEDNVRFGEISTTLTANTSRTKIVQRFKVCADCKLTKLTIYASLIVPQGDPIISVTLFSLAGTGQTDWVETITKDHRFTDIGFNDSAQPSTATHLYHTFITIPIGDHGTWHPNFEGSVRYVHEELNFAFNNIQLEASNEYAIVYEANDAYVFAKSLPEVTSVTLGDTYTSSSGPGIAVAQRDKWIKTAGALHQKLQFGASAPVNTNPPPVTGTCADSRLIANGPTLLTESIADSKHPRLASDRQDNVWMVFDSDRSGSDEIYVAKYYGACGKWNTSAQGGAETRLTQSTSGKVARSPNVAVDSFGEVHVVYTSNDTDLGNYEIFYMRSVSRGTSFLAPVRLTSQKGNAFMPDIAISIEDGKEKVNVVWHDDRFGNFEIMYAFKSEGIWTSSAQGFSDIRITEAGGDSLFPRIAADSKGNLRVVYHDARRGAELVGVFLSTYISLAKRWDSSGQGGVDQLLSPGGTSLSTHPDIAIDRTNGVLPVWQDDRVVGTESGHEKIYSSYCVKTSSTTADCFPAITKNEYNKLDVSITLVDCVDYEPLTTTNVPEVCVSIRAPGATFFRLANEDGNFGEWTEFKAGASLDSVIVPWVLSCGNGRKQICVQVQDANFVSFPICHEVTLSAPLPVFEIEFFKDAAMTLSLADYNGKPVAPEGDVFIKITSCSALVRPPTFDVISRGIHLIRNQSTVAIDPVTGDAGSGSFIGENAEGAFTATGSTSYKARFNVKRDDGLFHRDGRARIVVHGTDARGNSF